MKKFFTWWYLLGLGWLYLQQAKRYLRKFEHSGKRYHLTVSEGYSYASAEIADRLDEVYPE